VIILDIDGVVANLFEEVDYLLQDLGHDVNHVDHSIGYDWQDMYPGVSVDTINSIVSNPLTIKNSKPYEESWYWVNHYSSSYDIMFLTARNDALTNQTWDWFFEWDIPADFVVFQEEKVDFLKCLEVSVFVDDNPDVVSQARVEGIPSYLLNRPYNKTYDIDPAFRINSLWDIKCV
jgi:uncharacterized HAD superfamily protein